jgi:hypothetical protein
MLEKYIIYRRFRDDWKALGNKKMVRFFNKRLSEMRNIEMRLAENMEVQNEYLPCDKQEIDEVE